MNGVQGLSLTNVMAPTMPVAQNNTGVAGNAIKPNQALTNKMQQEYFNNNAAQTNDGFGKQLFEGLSSLLPSSKLETKSASLGIRG